MTDRRRNLLHPAVRRGPRSSPRRSSWPRSRRSSASTSRAASSLVYQAKPTPAVAGHRRGDRRARSTSCASASTSSASPSRRSSASGADQIDVVAARASRTPTRRADAGRQDRPAVLLRLGDERPRRRTASPTRRTSRSPAARRPATAPARAAQYDAVVIASKCKPTNTGKETTTGQYYLVDDKTEKVLAGPAETREGPAGARSTASKIAEGPNTEVVKVPQGTVVVARREAARRQGRPTRFYVLRDQPALSGTDIKNPEQNFDNGPGGTRRAERHLRLHRQGPEGLAGDDARDRPARPGELLRRQRRTTRSSTSRSCSTTSSSRRRTSTSSRTRTASTAANGSQISGGFTIQSAQDLANLLKTGALPIKLELISRVAGLGDARQAGAQPGPDRRPRRPRARRRSSCSSSTACSASIAVGALVVYALFFFALIKLIPITLTLPGIAGLILTIGVAADANIVIFERVKEEMRGGQIDARRRSPRATSKGLTAIIDANVVTFMIAFILFMLATAGVKGFAFTLGVGTLVSLFTAVLLTQAVLGTLGRSQLMHAARPRSARGERRQRVPLRLHGRVEVVLLAVRRDPADRRARDRRQGPELRHRLRVRHARRRRAQRSRPSENEIRDALAPLGLGDAKIQRISGAELGNNRLPDLDRDADARPSATRSSTTLEQGVRRRHVQLPDRSGRRSARPSPRARSSRSSPRCS